MKKKMLFVVVMVSCFLGIFSQAQAAEYLVSQATVTSVTNTGDNLSLFVVRTTGGSGPCAGSYTMFYLNRAADADAHKRAFALATTALITGKKVTIYNYVDSNCSNAAYIELFNQ